MATEVNEITEMRLCEASRVVLRVGQLYRFTVAPGCRMCESAAGIAPRTDAAEVTSEHVDRPAVAADAPCGMSGSVVMLGKASRRAVLGAKLTIDQVALLRGYSMTMRSAIGDELANAIDLGLIAWRRGGREIGRTIDDDDIAVLRMRRGVNSWVSEILACALDVLADSVDSNI